MVECREPTIERDNMACSTIPTIYSNVLAGVSQTGTGDCAMAVTSTQSASVGEGSCAECGEAIVDRFYLYALERRWHNSCLSCSVCSRQLESEGSCYVKDGLIFCKDDYFRRFGVQKCARCYDTIQSGQMVMRAQSNVYHVKCFTCTVCNSLLQTGDHFGIYADEIYCRNDFVQLQYNMDITATVQTSQFDSSRISCNQQSIDMISSSPIAPITIPANSNFEDLDFGDYPPPLSHSNFTEQQQNTKSQRPKKRRQADTNNIVRGTEQGWQQIGLNLLDPENTYHQNGTQHHVKQKRMRTSFKHHQLKVMKQYFTVNHNPDAKDLKQLSQKTGLSKRVLQVWFQNARAKFRRCQGEGGKDGNEGGDNLLNDEESNSNEDALSDAESQDLDSTTSGRSPSADMLLTSSPLDDLKPQNNMLLLEPQQKDERLLETPPPSSVVSATNTVSSYAETMPSICI